jgi:hypothetical protein
LHLKCHIRTLRDVQIVANVDSAQVSNDQRGSSGTSGGQAGEQLRFERLSERLDRAG